MTIADQCRSGMFSLNYGGSEIYFCSRSSRKTKQKKTEQSSTSSTANSQPANFIGQENNIVLENNCTTENGRSNAEYNDTSKSQSANFTSTTNTKNNVDSEVNPSLGRVKPSEIGNQRRIGYTHDLFKINKMSINAGHVENLVRKLDPVQNVDETPVNRVRFYSMVEAMYEDGLTYKEPLNIGSIDLNRPRRNTIAFSRTARGIANNYKLCNNRFGNYACSDA